MVVKVPCSACGALILPTTAQDTGGICMRCKREGSRKQSQIVQRAYAQPARCLSGFTVDAAGSMVGELDIRIECVRFQLSCPCGASEFAILGHPMVSQAGSGQRVLTAPVSLTCQTCGKARVLFDPKGDGYDAEIGCPGDTTEQGEPESFVCSGCGGSALHAAVSLEYSLEDDEMDDCKPLADRPQDFFTGLMLYGKCPRCNRLAEVLDYECA